jgi:hypothetical protein
MKMLYLEPMFVLTKADGHTPPQGVRAACARGLKLVPEYGGDGLTAGAKARARSMAGGGSVSMANIKRMKAFFARHTEANTASPPSPGYVAWLLWGGDAGKAWAGKMAKDADQAAKGFYLPAGLCKAGEGSRGGHIIGHTKSGKPIYAASHATYTATSPRGAYSPMHDNSVHQNNFPKMKKLLQSRLGYTRADHEEAQAAHKMVELIHRDHADKIYEAYTGHLSAPGGNTQYEALQALPQYAAAKVSSHLKQATDAMLVGNRHYAMSRGAAYKSQLYIIKDAI